MNRVALLAAVLALAACAPERWRAPVVLGGVSVPARALRQGERAYLLYCRACHGEKGDGNGPAAPGMRPPPRDFTSGAFKFAAVPAGALPGDEDLVRIVRSGLHGTAMLPWEGIPEPQLQAVVQYLKTFSPRWKDEEPGPAIRPPPDPWRGREAEAAAAGRKLYHGLAQCFSCHPAYAPRRFVHQASREMLGAGTVEFRDDMYGPVLKDSDFGVKILPPDFTRAELRSVRPDHRLEDLYRVIAAGVGGTAMPTWKDVVPDEQIWALAHYVDSLAALRGGDGPARLLADNLEDDRGWRPPASR